MKTLNLEKIEEKAFKILCDTINRIDTIDDFRDSSNGWLLTALSCNDGLSWDREADDNEDYNKRIAAIRLFSDFNPLVQTLIPLKQQPDNIIAWPQLDIKFSSNALSAIGSFLLKHPIEQIRYLLWETLTIAMRMIDIGIKTGSAILYDYKTMLHLAEAAHKIHDQEHPDKNK